MSNRLYFDIETVPNDPVLAEELGDKDKQALNALTGSVALIGWAVNDDPIHFISDVNGEETMLKEFWRMVWGLLQADEPLVIIGHNSVGFDAPFLIKRSWKYKIKMPNVLLEDISTYRPKRWLDTMRIFSFFNPAEKTTLKLMCKHLGFAAKTTEIEGKDFYKWWVKDKNACIAYCKEDVETLRQSAKILIP